MASGKYRMTGCARFFLALLIIIPLAYVAASFITGQDGLKLIKYIFYEEQKTTEVKQEAESMQPDGKTISIEALEKKIQSQVKSMDSLQAENMKLKKLIKELKQTDTHQ